MLRSDSTETSSTRLGGFGRSDEWHSLKGNTVEIIVTDTATATSGSLSPCGRGPGRGGQGSTQRLVRGRGQACSPLFLPSPARGEGEFMTGRLWGDHDFNGIEFKGSFPG